MTVPRGVFVTGTDTGVGKTVVSCAMLRAYAGQGVRAVGMKPVMTGGGVPDDDVALLAAASNVDAPLPLRNPYAFAPAIAPHLAAARAGVAIELERIAAAFAALDSLADCVVVEGAGGVFAPLDDRSDMLDLPATLRLDVVLVVGVRLGCISHALLSMLAIGARGLRCAGWVANMIEPMQEAAANVATLERRLGSPRLATFALNDVDAPAWTAASAALGLVIRGQRLGKAADPC